MKKNLKTLMIVGMMFIAVQGLLAQSIPTLEMQRNAPPLGNSNYGLGASLTPVVTEFRNDLLNNSNFILNTPQATFTVALTNQQFTGFNYGTANYNGLGVNTVQTTGLVFGIGPSLASDPVPQGGNPYERYNIIGEYGGNGGPTNAMFTSNPTATGPQLGTGITVANAGLNALNGAVEIFTTAQALYNNPNYPVGSRPYFGNLVLTFNRPVKNPVIHIAGLGGSYRYLPFGMANAPANYVSTFFTTELELVNTGLTSTLMSGNAFMSLSGNNILNNNNVNPNGGSIVDPTEFISNLGAATGSVRLNGTVQQLVYRVYLKSGTGSQFAWSVPGTLSLGAAAQRDPFTGDIWYVAASYDKPTQQISGSVYNDRDITDNNIYQSLTLPNGKTNVGGVLHANLLNSSGLAVATTPVSDEGFYLFDAVPPGIYTVQLTINPSAGTYAAPLAPPPTVLPTGWSNTGEIIGIGPGNDGNTNGISAAVVVIPNDIRTEINFGIRVVPCNGNRLFIDQLTQTNYFGGFESGANNFNTMVTVNGGVMNFQMEARTKLSPANYNIVYSPDLVASSGFSSFTPLGGMNQMVVKTTSASDTAWYLQDSVGFVGIKQGFFIKGSTGFFSGWFSKVDAGADPQIKIIVFDANNTAKVYGTTTQTITGPAGTWRFVNVNWTITDSLCKKMRVAIISNVNNSNFAMDNLCASTPAAGPPLPITLSEFNVSKVNCQANLAWKTSNELNADRFEIEVSTGNNAVYTSAGSVKAAGNSTSMQSYSFTYPMQPGVVYYFRIKMIDMDGSYKNSDTRSLSCTKGNTGIVIAPNPVKTSFTIMGMESGKNIILVYSSSGQLVKTQTITQNQGEVNIAYLTPGMYTVKVTSETGNTVVSKLIKY